MDYPIEVLKLKINTILSTIKADQFVSDEQLQQIDALSRALDVLRYAEEMSDD
tara:strand:- start:227 stop:385 length:159 start_codon:yes stop_codon:yes gene_type:complete